MHEGGGFRSAHMLHYIMIWSGHKEQNKKEIMECSNNQACYWFIFFNIYSINFAYADEGYTTIGTTISETIDLC